MKRRSARPFTVEIKHTRTSRASLPDAPARSRVGDDLWGDLQAAVADKPADMQPLRLAHPEPAPSVAPRRAARSACPAESRADVCHAR